MCTSSNTVSIKSAYSMRTYSELKRAHANTFTKLIWLTSLDLNVPIRYAFNIMMVVISFNQYKRL